MTSLRRRVFIQIPTERIKSAFALTILACQLAACGRAAPLLSHADEAWNDINDPLNLRAEYVVRLDALPSSGELPVKPWADTYWPSYQGGLANRWNDPNDADAFSYVPPNEVEVRAMSPEILATLSPAEKYDIFRGDFTYPFLASERARTSPRSPTWYGLCHGWAPAALNFAEPKPVTVTSAGGIAVPFGSSDVKSLLTFTQQDGRGSGFAGSRCNAEDPGDIATRPECRDINAGSFHVILANQIGLLQKGFVAEVFRGAQIWNHPVYGYSTQALGDVAIYPSAAPGTVRVVRMLTRMHYITELDASWEPMPFAQHPESASERDYDYTVELNASGEIIGGEWQSQDHPDFVWTQAPPDWEGYYQDVKTIYEASTHG